MLAAVAERFSARAAELGRQVEVEGDDVAFEADPKRIEQALGNLVENGLVHGAGTVTLRALRRDQQVELHVSDDGAGFPDEFAARAFDRFSRADEARRRSGSGLGLAIVEAIARAHGGTAGVVRRRRLDLAAGGNRVAPGEGAALAYLESLSSAD